MTKSTLFKSLLGKLDKSNMAFLVRSTSVNTLRYLSVMSQPSSWIMSKKTLKK